VFGGVGDKSRGTVYGVDVDGEGGAVKAGRQAGRQAGGRACRQAGRRTGVYVCR